MRIAQINFVCRVGSTGKIVHDIHEGLIRYGDDTMTYYGRGKRIEEGDLYKFGYTLESYIHSLLLRLGITLQYGGMMFATRRLIKHLEQWNPDVVHIHCLNGSCVNLYQLLNYLATHQVKTVVTHHAEFYYTGACPHAEDCVQFQKQPGCLKCQRPKQATKAWWGDFTTRSWQKMQQSFARFLPDNLMFVAVSPWVKERSALSPIVNKYPCKVILNGVNTSIFYRRNTSNSIKIQELEFKGPKLLYVSASFTLSPQANKGGTYVVELAKLMPHCTFIVAALEIGELKNLPSNIHVWGRAKTQDELAELYSCADVSIITSKRETFSMIVAESLCCGTPVVGFYAGGPESIALPQYSRFVRYGDLMAYKDAVNEILLSDFDRSQIAFAAQQKYNATRMVENYRELYQMIR